MMEWERSSIEIERAWSKDNLLYIIQELANNNVKLLSCMKQNLDMNRSISDIMGSMGFKIVQDRYTNRKIRNVVWNNNKTDHVLAEMAIDSVLFYVNYNEINHYEMEVEEKERNGSNARRDVIEELLSSSYQPFLRRWKYGKVAIGKGIKRLIELKGLKVEEYRNLTSATYDKIEKLITAGII